MKLRRPIQFGESMKKYKSLFIEKSFELRDVVKLYKEFNKKYFYNKLGTYPINIKTMKTVGGRVTSFGIKNKPEDWVVKKITFSDAIEYTDDEMYGIIMHEMIHVKMIEEGKGDPKDSHGLSFLNELKYLQSKTPFKIPLTDDIDNKKVNKDKVKSKDIIAIILNNNTSISLLNITLKNSIIEDIKSSPNAWLEKFKPTIMITNDIELQKYPVKRKIGRSLPMYRIDKEDVSRIRKEGKVIHQF